MTTLPAPSPGDPALAAAEPAPLGAPPTSLAHAWLQLEHGLDRLGDRLNPILVKEARQAMKSRQFVVTFALCLVCGWLWTVVFIALGVPAIFYAPVGPGILMGYYVVLSIPLLIVVPYAAFRSLAAEREDGTYELLSITTLTARQVVLGKLGSAVLQMMVYYSALAPCIAFTYLLRGIDIITIGLFLAYSFLASLLLCFLGLMMATITGARHWQVLISVVFVMALLVITFFWNMVFLSILASGAPLPLDDTDFWVANLCALSFYVPAALLLLDLAAGQITFASENRSTPIRRVLLVPSWLVAGWMTYYWLRIEQGEVLLVWAALATIYWTVAGACLSAEVAQLSPRAKRQLPQSFLGRMIFTWFNPGSGTGYIFAMLNLAAVLVTLWLVVGLGQLVGFDRSPNLPESFYFTVCLAGYAASYLGTVRLAVVGLRRVAPIGMLPAVLAQIICLIAGILFPLLIQSILSWGDESTFVYSYLQLPNFCWTLYAVLSTGSFGGAEVATLVGLGGAVVYLANLVVAAREVEHVRQQAPQRVLEDERLLHPDPAARRKRNPWDDVPVTRDTPPAVDA